MASDPEKLQVFNHMIEEYFPENDRPNLKAWAEKKIAAESKIEEKLSNASKVMYGTLFFANPLAFLFARSQMKMHRSRALKLVVGASFFQIAGLMSYTDGVTESVSNEMGLEEATEVAGDDNVRRMNVLSFLQKDARLASLKKNELFDSEAFKANENYARMVEYAEKQFEFEEGDDLPVTVRAVKESQKETT